MIGRHCLFALAVVTLAALTLAPFCYAQGQRELIAVLDLDVAGTTPAQASAVTDRLREELLRTGVYTLVDRSQLSQILEEQALQQTGCTSQECAVQVGRILGIRKIVAGKVTRLSDSLWQLSTLMVDVETAETLRAETVIHEGDFVGLLRSGAAEMAQRLSGKVTAAPSAAGVGQLFVASEPTGAEIALDGVPLHRQTEALLDPIPAGRHTVVLSKGILAAAAGVTVEPGQIARLELRLAPRPAVIEVKSTPLNATVRLDGREIGRTPLTHEATPGTHVLEVAREGHLPAARQLTLGVERLNRVQADLAPKGPEWLAYEDGHSAWNWKRWSAFGGAALLGLYGLQQAQATRDAIRTAQDTNSLQTFQAASDEATAAKSRSDISYLLAVLLLGLGWWIHADEPQTPPNPSRIEVSALPAGAGAAGVSVAWAW
jgi:hypothetical protein